MFSYYTQVWTAVLFVTLPSFALAFANVLAEAMVVEKSRGHSQEFAGRLQSCIWGGKEVGAILRCANLNLYRPLLPYL